jgi:hypothetical protein
VAINVMLSVNVHVIETAVVVEVAAAPIAALIAETEVAEAVVDAAIVADVPSPVPAVKAVAVMPETPVAGSPERALVGSLNPGAGHPVITPGRPRPIAGRPKIAVTRSLGLLVLR